ncbi:MAG: leucine--tRNA ligase [Alphaproteobacteria bacterium]|nr:leucine--tRNA ligase [Alphaproteobacteria bacterium]
MATDDIKKIAERDAKWQKRWADARVFVPKNDGSKPKYYNLIEFPFPSGSGLHVGHMLPYTGMDVMARYKRMRGFDVLFPIGYDSMGISSEKYAAKIGKHPRDSVAELIKIFEKDISVMGLSFDPDSKIATSDPEFIKWTQWMFIQFWRAGLAYKSELPMNWCPNCRTNLTNEELEDGCCERCHGPVEKKMKLQWNLAMTKYADRLIDDLALVDYPEKVKTMQINWIGRSYGADVDFRVGDDIMTVYTTRVDTIFGVTFCVIAPEHKLVQKWIDEGRITNVDAVREYIAAARAKSEIERTDITKDKTGIKLEGVMATNPFNGRETPIFISDYVLADYGFGAIMAVPAHDSRDWDFAKKFGLEIIPVLAGGEPDKVWEGDGEHINSEFLNGMDKETAIATAIKYGSEHGFARGTKKYKLKDWGFSRQMYWGEPIPMVYCEHCGWQPIDESELPLLQPYMEDYKPTDTGESPLARATDWIQTTCPKCGAPARRETDTMPQWAGSSWYFLRYLDPHNDKEFCSRAQMNKWMPVDHYNGGMEHTTRHVLYSRFWYKVLADLGYVPGVEPYMKRTSNGLIMGPDGQKMSKSRGNVVPSSDVVARAGADACRLAILYLAPWEQNNMNWSEDTLRGVERFLRRVDAMSDNLTDDAPNAEQDKLMNRLVADVTERLDGMKFNTAISAMMEFLNAFSGGKMPRAAYEVLIQMLNPFAPHLTEEMWEKLGHKDMLVFEPWPTFDASKLVQTSVTLAVTVNGKRIGEFVAPVDATEPEIIAKAREVAGNKVDGAEIVKTIVVPKKLVNFVIKK